MSVNIRFPNITAKSETEQINQIKSYLHQLVDQLNWALGVLEAASGSASASGTEPSYGDISEETFYELKSLLIQAADNLNAYYDKINTKLEGQYVTQVDFEKHKKEASEKFDDLAEQYVAQTDFEAYKQEMSGLDEKYVLQTEFDEYKQEVSKTISDLQQIVEELQQMIESNQETGGEVNG